MWRSLKLWIAKRSGEDGRNPSEELESLPETGNNSPNLTGIELEQLILALTSKRKGESSLSSRKSRERWMYAQLALLPSIYSWKCKFESLKMCCRRVMPRAFWILPPAFNLAFFWSGEVHGSSLIISHQEVRPFSFYFARIDLKSETDPAGGHWGHVTPLDFIKPLITYVECPLTWKWW